MSYGFTPDMISSTLELFFTMIVSGGIGIYAIIKLLF
jgi:hypothetical protein